jgi:hypothetical protein
MSALRASAAILVVLAAGCDRPLTGGTLVPSNRVPTGVLVASYAPASCTDGSERTAPRVFDHLRDTRGASMLVERASSAEWMVITNAFADGGSMVFQAIQENSQPRVVWEYRVPAEGVGNGTFRASSSFTLEAQPGGPFRATLHSDVSRCILQRVGGGQPGAAGAQPGGSTAPPAAAPLAAGVNEPKSWGYDGSSFKAGDRVLVAERNRAVAATVLKGDGEQYWVHYEGSPPESGAWVRPWRIVGRLRP